MSNRSCAAVKMFLLLPIAIVLLAGCGGEPSYPSIGPIQYRYLSSSQVEILYNGQSYLLNRYTESEGLPFEYEFEDDGDVDIAINGQVYDIDSPYDIDIEKTKVKKKTIRQASKTKTAVVNKKVATQKKFFTPTKPAAARTFSSTTKKNSAPAKKSTSSTKKSNTKSATRPTRL